MQENTGTWMNPVVVDIHNSFPVTTLQEAVPIWLSAVPWSDKPDQQLQPMRCSGDQSTNTMYQLARISASASEKEIPFPGRNKFGLEKRHPNSETPEPVLCIENDDIKYRFFDNSGFSVLCRQDCCKSGLWSAEEEFVPRVARTGNVYSVPLHWHKHNTAVPAMRIPHHGTQGLRPVSIR